MRPGSQTSADRYRAAAHSLSRTSLKGPSIKYVTLFLANIDPPPPCHTLSHIQGPPKKVRHTSRTLRFLVHLVQKSRTKAPCTNSLSIVHGGFCPGVLSGGLFFLIFCPGFFF